MPSSEFARPSPDHPVRAALELHDHSIEGRPGDAKTRSTKRTLWPCVVGGDASKKPVNGIQETQMESCAGQPEKIGAAAGAGEGADVLGPVDSDDERAGSCRVADEMPG